MNWNFSGREKKRLKLNEKIIFSFGGNWNKFENQFWILGCEGGKLKEDKNLDFFAKIIVKIYEIKIFKIKVKLFKVWALIFFESFIKELFMFKKFLNPIKFNQKMPQKEKNTKLN